MKFILSSLQAIFNQKFIHKVLKNFLIIPSILFFIFFMGSCEEKKSSGSLQIDIEPDRGSIVSFTISNKGDSDLLFFEYDTPINGHVKPYFKITKEDGEEVPYIGRVAAIELNSSNWTLLEPGQSIKFPVDLYQAYGFTSTIEKCNITYVSSVSIIDGNDAIERIRSGTEDFSSNPELEQVELSSNEINVEIDTGEQDLISPIEEVRGCSSSNESAADTSRDFAEGMTSKALTYMNHYGMNSLWNTWWGEDNTSRYEFIKGAYEEIHTATKKSWDYECSSTIYCGNSIIAYVYPGKPYKVWLCSLFFTYSTKNRASVLLHEASHWDEVVGTEDYTYGEDNCKKLAKSSPNKAKLNADNYRFYSLKTYSEEINNAPTASFTYSINELEVKFTDKSTDPENQIASRKWNFGDSKTSTATNPSHTYSQSGTYTVKLIVTDNGGLTDSYSKSITVKQTKYTLVVNNGSGDGQYTSGQTVTISADEAPTGKAFYRWLVNSGSVNIADVTQMKTTMTMPSSNAQISAGYMEVETEESEIEESNQDVGCGSILDVLN